MKHQVIILSALLVVATMGVRLEGLVRATSLVNTIASAAIENPAPVPAVVVSPMVHLESAPSQPPIHPALPEALAKSLTSSSFIILNEDTRAVIQERHSTDAVPLASLTKLLASVVVADHVHDWKQMVEIQPQDIREGEKVVDVGNRLSFADLFAVTLIRSSNTGMMALGRAVGLPPEQFAAEMNTQAGAWGLHTTVITDPTGLTPTTVGSASDIAVILQKALERPEIRAVVSKAEYEWPFYDEKGTVVGHKRVISTNALIHPNALGGGLTIEGGKTGFIPESHYHVAVEAESAQHHHFIVVVMGAKTFDARFQEAKALLEWASSILPVPENNI